MNVERQAVKDIKFLASTMRGLIELADLLGDAADLSKLRANLQVEIEDLTKHRDKLQGETGDLQAAHATVRDEMESNRRASLERSQAILDDAQRKLAQAEKSVSNAKAEAERIIQDAKAEGRAVVAREIEAIKARL